MEHNTIQKGRFEIMKMIDKQREQAQQDILCILYELEEEVLDNVCQVIVDRFNVVKNSL